MKKIIFLLIFTTMFSTHVDAFNARVGLEFSFDGILSEGSDVSLGVRGSFNENYIYEVSKSFSSQKELSFFFGREFDTLDKVLVGGEIGSDLKRPLIRWRLSTERNYFISDLIFDYEIIENKNNVRVDFLYNPEGENYYFNYNFVEL